MSDATVAAEYGCTIESDDRTGGNAMRIVGIDPGKTGAIAVVEDTWADVQDCPVFGTRSRPGEFNPVEMWRLLDAYNPNRIIIEQAQAMPKQGVSSTFQTGYGYGIWVGLIAAFVAEYEVPWTAVRPAVWKRAMLAGLDKTDKTVSRVAAVRMFPQLSGQLARVSDHGRAEALLIAAYGQREMG